MPIGIATALLVGAARSASREAERAGAFDVARRRARSPPGLIVLVYAIVKARGVRLGLARARSGSAAVALALLGGVRVHRAAHRRRRWCGSSIFRIRSLAVANFVLLLVAGGLFALFFFATLYVQEILGFTPLEAGLAFLPVTAGIVRRRRHRAAAASSGSACAPNAIVGMVIAAVGLFLLSRRAGRRHLRERPAARACC